MCIHTYCTYVCIYIFSFINSYYAIASSTSVLVSDLTFLVNMVLIIYLASD